VVSLDDVDQALRHHPLRELSQMASQGDGSVA